MALYGETYWDEDIDDFDEALGESYLDYDEDLDDDDYGEAGTRRRSGRGRIRVPTRRGGRQGFGFRGSRSGADSVPPKPVRTAFRNVGRDVATLDKRINVTRKNQQTEKWIDIISLLLFQPKPINAELAESLKAKDGTEIKNITVGIQSNVLPLLIVNLFKGGGTKGGIQQFLPVILILLLVSPNTFKDLGLDGLGQNTTSNATGAQQGGLQLSPIVLILLVLLLTGKKL